MIRSSCKIILFNKNPDPSEFDKPVPERSRGEKILRIRNIIALICNQNLIGERNDCKYFK
jgi:hypothetical protein